MNQTPNRVRNWIAVAIVMVAALLSTFVLTSPSVPSPAQAANLGPVSFVQTQLQAPFYDRPVRRESLPPLDNGRAPLTGPASPFRPLDTPIFGDNYRANTDTQSPNRAQQEPSIAVNPTNPLNVVAAAKDERAGTNTKQIWIYTSTDGGVTWINQQFPLVRPCVAFLQRPGRQLQR